MSDAAAWHPCEDGLTLIAEAVRKIADPDAAHFVTWMNEGDHFNRKSLEEKLVRVLDTTWMDAETKTMTPTRREMVRRWLQSNKHEADAKEFESRLTKLIQELGSWESRAHYIMYGRDEWRIKEQNGEFIELYDIFGRENSDWFYGMTEEAADNWNWLRQLDGNLRAQLAKQPALDFTKFQEQVESIGQVLVELQTRLKTVDESAGIAKAGIAAQRPDDEAKPTKPKFGPSSDYTTFSWGEAEPFVFSKRQAACVCVMWLAYQQQEGFLDQHYILENAADVYLEETHRDAAQSRHDEIKKQLEGIENVRNLSQVFKVKRGGKTRMHEAWKTMIVTHGKTEGKYKIVEPGLGC